MKQGQASHVFWLEEPLVGAILFYCCCLVFFCAISAHDLESLAEQEFSHFDLFNSCPQNYRI